ncbi:uncharacterized protein LOC125666332 [Ostrea edulis]|uniref:uncharacterized protein LOC125666332 n=1 Tax=Ostrea edulis TaxID=37623 RepID=UPI0024AF66A0|nr:uncharacterized protein LOC125666332 [Ostrea edulis]XP_056007692.1 uncharacterized protein LOC125666332 [Ostrea edulis]
MMEKKGLPSSSPPDYTVCDLTNAHPGTSDVITPDINPPPSYDAIFSSKIATARKTRKSNRYDRDDRNTWEIVHECFEMSILQQIIWLAALAFSISYIVYGLKYKGKCYKKRLNDKGKVEEEEDMTSFIQAEGGVICATILYAFLCRILVLCDTHRKNRVSRGELEGKKKCGGNLFFLGMALYIANFGLCVAGATKIIPFYDVPNTSDNKTDIRQCHPEFYNFYRNTKIGELAVLMPYAAYIIISLFIVVPMQKTWFLRRKWCQWAKLLDADKDGVISEDDMKKTNAKLEEIRKRLGARNTAMEEADQKKWWNEHIFKTGRGKDISVADYVSYLQGTVGAAVPHEKAGKVKAMVTGFFNIFSTEGFRKKNLILGEEDFVKFWAILADVDERHCRRMLIRHFPTPLTLAYFLEDFTAFLSHQEFFDEYSNRIFNVVKFRRSNGCCKE